MKGTIKVSAKTPSGKEVMASVLDLTDESFRVFMMDQLIKIGAVTPEHSDKDKNYVLKTIHNYNQWGQPIIPKKK